MTSPAPAELAPVHPVPANTEYQSSDSRIELGDSRERLLSHRLYRMVDRPERIRQFMEAHVWAVWDFQSLLKAMQRHLTCVDIPWVPSPDPQARRLVNEIVLDEESDLMPDGTSASHFELYLKSMEAAGANCHAIERVISGLTEGQSLDTALSDVAVSAAAKAFVNQSFSIIASGSPHRIVAAFTYGREDVIPAMFRQLVSSLAEEEPGVWGTYRYYLQRHIEHDDEHHAPICRRIVAGMCGHDPVRWAEASETARLALESRIAFWDAVAEQIEGSC
jgi:pyrroloquinoline quinone (PQQ) biosynthesis protein C